MASRIPTPPPSPNTPQLILCADGGGSKICVVIRSDDGQEVRGTAGPCNIQSVGCASAAQSLLLATYRALYLLPASYLPTNLHVPPIASACHIPSSNTANVDSEKAPKLPNLNMPTFQYAWLGLAGVNCETDAKSFISYAATALGLSEDRVKLSNDVNLLAAPGLNLPRVDHVVAIVAGTGTVGRTVQVSSEVGGDPHTISTSPTGSGLSSQPTLPLKDVAVAKGWGYLLCDEGSAFWLGRLAIRNVLALADRHASSSVYSSSPPPLLPLHRNLLEYFGTSDPADLITLASLAGPSCAGLDVGEATSRRNAIIAGAARVVFRWAFPEDGSVGAGGLPTPPGSSDGLDTDCDQDLESDRESDIEIDMSTIKRPAIDTSTPQAQASRSEALRLVRMSVVPLIEMTTSLLGDQTIVRPARSALAVGGGLMMSKGYRTLLLDGLKKEGVAFRRVLVVADAAGEGARGLAKVIFGDELRRGQ